MEPWATENSPSTTMNLVILSEVNGRVDLATYEHMLEYYHGMCRDLCIKSNWSEYTYQKICLFSFSKKINSNFVFEWLFRLTCLSTALSLEIQKF